MKHVQCPGLCGRLHYYCCIMPPAASEMSSHARPPAGYALCVHAEHSCVCPWHSGCPEEVFIWLGSPVVGTWKTQQASDWWPSPAGNCCYSCQALASDVVHLHLQAGQPVVMAGTCIMQTVCRPSRRLVVRPAPSLHGCNLHSHWQAARLQQRQLVKTPRSEAAQGHGGQGEAHP